MVLVYDNADTAVQVSPELVEFSDWWGSWCLTSGSPSSTAESRRSIFSSEDVATWTCSQLTVCGV